jgi:hypothetical protein
MQSFPNIHDYLSHNRGCARTSAVVFCVNEPGQDVLRGPARDAPGVIVRCRTPVVEGGVGGAAAAQ